MADEEQTNIDHNNEDIADHIVSSDDNTQNEDKQIDNEPQINIIPVISDNVDTIDFNDIDISERKSDSQQDIELLQDEDEDEDHIDSNTPLKPPNDGTLHEEEERDVFDNDNIDPEPSSPKIYTEYMRRASISTSDIPHSLQVLTPQHVDRPKDDVLSQIYDMGFDRNLAEKAYNIFLNDNNGNHGAFTTEQVIELMLSQDLELYSNSGDIELNIAQRKEEEKEDIVRDLNVTKKGDCVECPICRIDRLTAEIYNTSCGHNYCTICLEKHYKTSIENGVVSFVCMEQECERVIAEKELFLFIHDEVYKNKYYKFLRNVKLAKDPTIRWCVKAGCDTPIKRKSRKQRKLECPKCHTMVCFECAGLYYNENDKNNSKQHNCNKKLDEKLNTWAKTANYDVEFCPKCSARIEKLSGCNHMRCTYCKYEFCWLCRKEFKKGHYDPSNILFGCPNGENATKRPSRCSACCVLFRSCLLMCCLPFRICCWRMNEQGFPWCCCWCCCQD